MTGYEGIASDASGDGQMVVLTYPLVGNYGTFERASESRRPWIEGLIVRELVGTCREGTVDLEAYLRAYGVPGLAGSDTRALVRRLRAKGTPRGAILQVPPHRSQTEDIAREAVATARSIPALATKPLVVESTGLARQVGSGPKVALLDTGVKENQIRCLVQKGATVKVFPATAMAREILSWSPDGIVISTGPGDPASIPSDSGFVVSSRNLNDGSVEGLAHERLPIRTYQYHPEGAPGPKDNERVFDAFLDDVREAVSRK